MRNKPLMTVRAREDAFVVKRKILHKGRFATKGCVFIHVTFKSELRNQKYSATKLILGGQGKEYERKIVKELTDLICEKYQLKLHSNEVHAV